MLPAKNRLSKAGDFKKIYALGRSAYSPYFRLKYLANPRQESRFAVVVSTKVSKKATARNRLKRQTREILRLRRKEVAPGFDLIISAQSRALGREYRDLEKDLISLMAKARLIK